jgi:hypothetical protein
MQTFKNKYQYKDYLAEIISNLDISKDTFEKMFSQVFMEIFEKEQQYPCFVNFFKANVIHKIAEELKKIKKNDKTIFLPLYEDYVRLNTELDDIIIHIKKNCQHGNEVCKMGKDCIIEISKYPTLQRITAHGELESFRPDLITSQEFIDFFKENIGKYGLYFLYNLNKELLFLGKSLNLGETIIDIIWQKNIDGYVAVSYTNSIADMLIYEQYYILKEKPLQLISFTESDELTISIKTLKRTELIKIYSNN